MFYVKVGDDYTPLEKAEWAIDGYIRVKDTPRNRTILQYLKSKVDVLEIDDSKLRRINGEILFRNIATGAFDIISGGKV